MISPDIATIHIIGQLIQNNISFALYRLPLTDEPVLVLQSNGQAENLYQLTELNGRRGFVLSPFVTGNTYPIVLIRPDHMAYGWSRISELLHSLWEEKWKEYRKKTEYKKSTPPSENTELPGYTTQKQQYTTAFQKFITPLQNQEFQKLVLSRKSSIRLPEGFSPAETFVRACNSYPRMMISLCHTPQTGTWIGSTPEIILSGNKEQWHTVALAGTMTISKENIPEEWSWKNREEQDLVSKYIRNTLKKFSTGIKEKGPYTARAGQLVHLKTDFHFQLNNAGKIGDILHELHPTPAVCGLPKDKAYSFIASSEGYDRSYYSGIIGWISPDEDTTLYVNLRCMHVGNQQADLYAGGGILPQSEMETEWEETRQKMNTMRNIIQ